MIGQTRSSDEEMQQTTVVTTQTRQVSSCLARIRGGVVALSLCSGTAWHNSCCKSARALAWQRCDIRAGCSIWETSACEYWLWVKEGAVERLNRWINKRTEWRNSSFDCSFNHWSNYTKVLYRLTKTAFSVFHVGQQLEESIKQFNFSEDLVQIKWLIVSDAERSLNGTQCITFVANMT